MFNQDGKALKWMQKFLRFNDYIAASALYLQGNYLMKEPLKMEHIKPRILGHWGTVPGLNFIYANLNYLIWKHKCEVLFVTGPGHGAPAILANLFSEGTLEHFYPEVTLDADGMAKLIKGFSWPFSHFPSHVTPSVPGSILEGGELGYSLSTAFGAAFDNPDLIVAAIVGDGESESGPLTAAWHSIKWLNPKTSGAVLPILHVNGFKISNPTIPGTMDDKELRSLYSGFGWNVKIVEGKNIEKKMIMALEECYQEIRKIQKDARNGKKIFKPKWPMIVLRSLKGMHGIKTFHGKRVEGSFRSHGIPLEHLKEKDEFDAVEKWLSSYKVSEFFDASGQIDRSLFQFMPEKKYRIGMNKHAIGGNMLKEIKVPDLKKYAIKVKKRGEIYESSMKIGALLVRDTFKTNKTNFRVMCPDELESNQWHGIFEGSKRAYMWPVPDAAENVDQEGRAMEMLSEHTLQGWLQGYILTGRYGMFVTYEAFATIISSMLDQYGKFLKQSFKVKWRKPVSSPMYILSSVGWRQEHNGFSHQNPSFVSSMLEKHGEFTQIYYPSDANSFLVALDEALKRKNGINVIVVGKRPLPQWLTLDEAKAQAVTGIGVWDWVGGKEATKKPDVVLASAGDYMTDEALLAVKICHEMMPEMKIRYVNVSELSGVSVGDYSNRATPKTLSHKEFVKFFTEDKPIIFNYHGYRNDIEQIFWGLTDSNRFTIHAYSEEGSTTTPFDMAIRNKVSRYHLAMNMVEKASLKNKAVAKKKDAFVKLLNEKISDHHRYIIEFGDDPKEIKDFKW